MRFRRDHNDTGVAYLTRTRGFDAGVVISASHNPFQDNGIKIFTPSGKKADEATERTIEADVNNGEKVEVRELVSLDESNCIQLQQAYSDHLAAEFPELDLSKMKIIVDCANGAASHLAPELFGRFGADVTAIHAEPNGRNINENCGSLHLEHLQTAVIESDADLGVAFDGDADRALFVNEKARSLTVTQRFGSWPIFVRSRNARKSKGNCNCDEQYRA